MVNVLITSASNKVPLVKCIKAKWNGLNKIIVADINPKNISHFFASDYWKMPLINELKKEEIVEYCKKNNVTFIIPTRDADLLYFSQYKSYFQSHEINVLVSSLEPIKIANDKLYFNRVLNQFGFQSIPTSISIDFEAESYVIKERYGAGSKQVYINIDLEELQELYDQFESPIIQPFIKGKEYSIDLYVTQTRKVKASVVRERMLVIDGESQITEVSNHIRLEQIISEVALALNLEGHVMFQAIEDENGDIWIVECNARIGGASTLSIYAGLDTFNWWEAECNGINIDDWPVEIKKLKQVRYKKDLIL